MVLHWTPQMSVSFKPILASGFSVSSFAFVLSAETLYKRVWSQFCGSLAAVLFCRTCWLVEQWLATVWRYPQHCCKRTQAFLPDHGGHRAAVSISQVVVTEGTYNGLRVLFYAVPGTNLFKGSEIYAGGYNEREAYLFFCRAVLEYFKVGNSMMQWPRCL